MAGTELRQVRLEAIESVTGWHLRIVLTAHDEEGSIGEPEVFVSPGPIQTVNGALEQAWLILQAAQLVLADATDRDSVWE